MHNYSYMEKSEIFTQHSLQIRTPLYLNNNKHQIWRVIVKIKLTQFYSNMQNLWPFVIQKENFYYLKTAGTSKVCKRN